MPTEGALTTVQNTVNKLNCEVFVGNIPPETQAPTLQVRRSYVCMVITYNKGKDQPDKIANPASGQLNRENDFFPVAVRA